MRDSRHNRSVAKQSLEIFQDELCKNRGRIEYDLPFHMGLRDVVAGMADKPERAGEVRSMLEGLEPALLLNTAWETALATGALTHMEVKTVSGLSMTYSEQDRFMTVTGEGIPRLLLLPGATPREKIVQAQQALTYLNDLVRSEQRLQAIYNEAIYSTELAKEMMAGERPRPSAIAPAVGDSTAKLDTVEVDSSAGVPATNPCARSVSG